MSPQTNPKTSYEAQSRCLTVKQRILVVGVGLAGTILSHELLKRGHKVTAVDAHTPYTASRAAAGVINPVIGKRFVIKRNFAEKLAGLEAFYCGMEALIGEKVFYRIKIQRYLTTPAAKFAFAKRVRQGLPDYIEYDETNDWFIIHESAYCRTELLTKLFRNYLTSHSSFIEAAIAPEDIETGSDHIKWRGQRYDYIIFARGYKDETNAWFPNLPFESAFGTVLTCEPHPTQVFSAVQHTGKWLLPYADNLLRAGATFAWDLTSPPSLAHERKEIIGKLSEQFPWAADLKEIEARQGIRPIMKDRLPILGLSPLHSRVCIFNGLGAHGVMTGPGFAQELVDFLEGTSPLPAPHDVGRFYAEK